MVGEDAVGKVVGLFAKVINNINDGNLASEVEEDCEKTIEVMGM